MGAKKRVLLLTGEEAGYHWALKLHGENLALHHSRPNQNGAEHQSSSGVTCEGAWPRKTRSGPALGVGPGTVRETRGWGLEAGLLDASEVGSYLRCARSAFQDAVGAGFLLQAELPGLLRLQAGERSEPRLGEGCLFSPLPAPLTVWGGGRGESGGESLVLLGKQPLFLLRCVLSHRQRYRSLRCPSPAFAVLCVLGGENGGRGAVRFAGRVWSSFSAPSARSKGAELASLPVGTGWSAPPFPLQESQRSAWASSALLGTGGAEVFTFPGGLNPSRVFHIARS